MLFADGRVLAFRALDELAARLAETRQSVLVAAPGSEQAMAPPEIPGLGEAYRARRMRGQLQTALVFGAVGVLNLALAAIATSAEGLMMALFPVAIAVGFAADARWFLRDPTTFGDRIRFGYWLIGDGRGPVLACTTVVLMTLALALQWSLERQWGGQAPVWQRFGMMFPAMDAGEWWRTITGGFLHYSFEHWAINTAMLAVIVPIVRPFLRALLLPIFIAAVALTMFAQWAFGTDTFDNAGGTSGGVYTLYAYAVAASLRGVRILPPGLEVVFATSILGAIVVSEVTTATAGTSAHLSGIALGSLLAATARAPGPDLPGSEGDAGDDRGEDGDSGD